MSLVPPLLEKALDAIHARGERRLLRPYVPAGNGRLRNGQQELLDFSSNDYLGLSQHALLKERASEWTRLYGAGSGASRLVTGTMPVHMQVEERIAAFKGSEAALLFGSGWQANAAVLPALLKALPGASLFADRLIHASLHHGCAAAGIRQIRYRHNDLDHLEQLLSKHERGGPRLIVTESVFSMDGDRVDLPRLVEIARRHDAFLYLDEAHATGVLGPHGAGLSSEVPGGADLIMGTFSKAMGSFGAYVAGSRLLCDYLVNACGGFIFATAPPPAVLGAIDAALDLVPDMEAERAHLTALGQRLRGALGSAGIDCGASTTQIVPAIVGSADDAVALSRHLEKCGILAAAIRPPTIPAGSSRIRIALRSTHTDADLDRLIQALTRRG